MSLETKPSPWVEPRSILFVSPLSPRHLAKAPQSGADAIQLDLEDAIAPGDKAAARAQLAPAVAGLRKNGVRSVIVRVNAPWLMAIEDIAAAVDAGVDCITLPKVEAPGRVAVVCELLGELEARSGRTVGTTRLLLLIESPRGLADLDAILAASPRVAAVTLGPEDFAKAIGGASTIAANTWANVAVLTAARAAGVTPLGFPGSITIVQDTALFRLQVEHAKDLGFGGAAAIHPVQIAILNEIFSPTADELDEARRIVAAARATTVGAFLLEGKMIDAPIVDRAEALLDRAARALHS